MRASVENIANGIVKYIRQEMLPVVPDKAVKMVLDGAGIILETKPDIIGNYLRNGMIGNILSAENGMYDVDMAADVLGKLMQKYGNYEMEIQPIKFLLKDGARFTFSEEDVRKIKTYIEGGA